MRRRRIEAHNSTKVKPCLLPASWKTHRQAGDCLNNLRTHQNNLIIRVQVNSVTKLCSDPTTYTRCGRVRAGIVLKSGIKQWKKLCRYCWCCCLFFLLSFFIMCNVCACLPVRPPALYSPRRHRQPGIITSQHELATLFLPLSAGVLWLPGAALLRLLMMPMLWMLRRRYLRTTALRKIRALSSFNPWMSLEWEAAMQISS